MSCPKDCCTSFPLLYSVYRVNQLTNPEETAAEILKLVSGISEADVLVFDAAPNSQKVYDELEIHHNSPQIVVVLSGEVLVPVAKEFSSDCVEFVPLSEGEAIVVNTNVWHFGAVAPEKASKFAVAFRKGTAQNDCEKRKLPVSVPIRK